MTADRQTSDLDERTDDKIHPVRWDRDVWEKLVKAAAIWAEREHLNITVADVIRTGAIKRAEEILSSEQAA